MCLCYALLFLFSFLFLCWHVWRLNNRARCLNIKFLSFPCLFGDLLLRIHHGILVQLVLLLRYLLRILLTSLRLTLPFSRLLCSLKCCRRLLLLTTSLVPAKRGETLGAAAIIIFVLETLHLYLLRAEASSCRLH